jgi:hypothetical protein
MSDHIETIWVTCANCGHKHRKHGVLHKEVKRIYQDPDGGPYEEEYHRLVECMGCESIKYVASSQEFYGYDSDESDYKVYPDAPGTSKRREPAISPDDAIGDDGKPLVPEQVWKMYKETLDALNAGVRTLAGGGLRATVEAICLNNGIENGNLQVKINELAKKNLLTNAQAELLHEERYLGNAALHELATPSPQDLEDGLGIVEGLITTIYVLPSKAQRLKQRREAKARG